MCSALKWINTRKAPGPDGIPGRALKVCADQLADVFTDFFNMSLLRSVVPTCFKKITVKSFITSSLPDSLDPLHVGNRSTDDTVSVTFHTALSHLDQRDTYVRMLFLDYSSAFNTTVPFKLITKLRDLVLNTAICDWILNFLTGRPQAVGIGTTTSSTLTLNTDLLHPSPVLPVRT